MGQHSWGMLVVTPRRNRYTKSAILQLEKNVRMSTLAVKYVCPWCTILRKTPVDPVDIAAQLQIDQNNLQSRSREILMDHHTMQNRLFVRNSVQYEDLLSVAAVGICKNAKTIRCWTLRKKITLWEKHALALRKDWNWFCAQQIRTVPQAREVLRKTRFSYTILHWSVTETIVEQESHHNHDWPPF